MAEEATTTSDTLKKNNRTFNFYILNKLAKKIYICRYTQKPVTDNTVYSALEFFLVGADNLHSRFLFAICAH